jgi:hypothetical protein
MMPYAPFNDGVCVAMRRACGCSPAKRATTLYIVRHYRGVVLTGSRRVWPQTSAERAVLMAAGLVGVLLGAVIYSSAIHHGHDVLDAKEHSVELRSTPSHGVQRCSQPSPQHARSTTTFRWVGRGGGEREKGGGGDAMHSMEHITLLGSRLRLLGSCLPRPLSSRLLSSTVRPALFLLLSSLPHSRHSGGGIASDPSLPVLSCLFLSCL